MTDIYNEQANLRWPIASEANLMVAMAGISVILFSLLGGALGKRYGVSATLMSGQPALGLAFLWIAVRRFDFRSTLRIYPIGWDTVGWSMMIGIIFWPVVAGGVN